MPASVSVDDFRRRANRCLPRIISDFLEGGSDSEEALADAEASLRRVKIVPRCMVDVSAVEPSVTLFGTEYALPIGVSPVGLGGLIHPRAEEILAGLAQQRGVPYILSLVATAPLERIAELAPDVLWFQIYVPKDARILSDLVERAKRARVKVLVLTVDGPVQGRRRRDMRNGFSLPLRLTAGTVLDLMAHPSWALRQAFAGLPVFGSLLPYARGGTGALSLAQFVGEMFSSGFDWDGVRQLRALWDGPLVLKGVLDGRDARTAAGLGVDGIIVSTHGGRQFSAAPASIDRLSPICDAVGAETTIMLDSGIRSGTDAAKAICLGAAAVFSGRSFFYGLAAEGRSGGEAIFRIFDEEYRTAMALAGVTRSSDFERLQSFPSGATAGS